MDQVTELKKIIARCESSDAPSDDLSFYTDLDIAIVTALGWSDRYDLPDTTTGFYPRVFFSRDSRPVPQFTRSFYEVAPHLDKDLGWDFRRGCPNPDLEALMGGKLPSMARFFNLDKRIDVYSAANTLELAFCAAWLKLVIKKIDKPQE